MNWKDQAKGALFAIFLLVILTGAYAPGSYVQSDSGSITGGQTNVAVVLNLPSSFDGANWTRAGCTNSKLISATSTNATSIKASAGVVYGIYAVNSNSTVTNFRYVKLYNKASAPTVGSDTPTNVYSLPGTGGGVIAIPPTGMAFTTGIALAITTGAPDNDTGSVAANEIVVNVCYK